MSTTTASTNEESGFEKTCSALEELLSPGQRTRILAGLWPARDAKQVLAGLRSMLKSDVFRVGNDEVSLARMVSACDADCIADGFHVLRDWDGKADRLNDERIPVEVIDFLLAQGFNAATPERMAVILDYYFLYLLALLSLKVWDSGDPNDNMDRLQYLLDRLQGPDGSQHQFVSDAETLPIVATSHFEPDNAAYDRLLVKVRRLNPIHQLRTALVCAGVLASHLRFGFEYFYRRDLTCMRDDNVPDYGWLCFAVTTLMRRYSELRAAGGEGQERDRIVDGLISGLSPDARAFVGKTPAGFAPYPEDCATFKELWSQDREALLEEFQKHRPTPQTYSPMGFGFNFPHNIVKAGVVDAVLRGQPWGLSFNALLTGVPREEPFSSYRRQLALILMEYAVASPDTIRKRPVPAVVYDPYAGMRSFNKAIGILREASTPSTST